MSELLNLIEQLSEKIAEMENRLSRLTTKVVLDETKVIAGERELEGKTYLSREDGGIIKEVRIGVCDICGRGSEKFNACIVCQRKLDNPCSIMFQNRVYCVECLSEILPLTKQEYKLLTILTYDVQPKALTDIAKMKKDEVKACESSLIEKQLIEQKGFLFFQETSILDRGLETLEAYRQVYAKEGDVITFEEELMRLADG